MPFPDSVKDAAFVRSSGRCQCRRIEHRHPDGRCTNSVARSGVGGAEFNHVQSQQVGGADTLANCEVLCTPCHQATRSYGRH